MKKIYKTDTGTLSFIGFGILLFLTLTLVAFFGFGGAPLKIKLVGISITIFGILFFFVMFKYEVIISDDSIATKMPFLFFLNKYRTMKFEEIKEVYNVLAPFPEMPVIFLKSNDKKLISIMVGFGLPWDALLDILERLPKDVKITFEPDLWKRIKKPLLNEKVKRINIIATVVIFLSIVWFSYFLWSIFKLHRIPFPINFFLGNPQGELFK